MDAVKRYLFLDSVDGSHPSMNLFHALTGFSYCQATMLSLIEVGLRRGLVPMGCAVASVCAGMHAWEIHEGALEWKALAEYYSASKNDDHHHHYDHQKYSQTAQLLRQYAATTAAISITSASITVQALLDWRQYGHLETLQGMEEWLLRQHRWMYMTRTPVLATAMAAFTMADYWTGAIRIHQPNLPAVVLATSSSSSITPQPAMMEEKQEAPYLK